MAADGVTGVSVAATHRRRGIPPRPDLVPARDDHWAAPRSRRDRRTGGAAGCRRGRIRGRFGYGVATRQRQVEIDRRRARFRADVPGPGGVRFVELGEAREQVPEIHRCWCAGGPAALAHTEGEEGGAGGEGSSGGKGQRRWERAAHHRRGAGGRFHPLHRRVPRISDGRRHLPRLRGLGGHRRGIPRAVAAAARPRPGDHRGHDGADPRRSAAVAAGGSASGSARRAWPTAPGRGCSTSRPCSRHGATPWRSTWCSTCRTPRCTAAAGSGCAVAPAARWPRQRGGPDGTTCEPVAGPVDLRVDVAALGTLAFGGTRARALTRAGPGQGDDDGCLRHAAAAFVADREPRCGTGF